MSTIETLQQSLGTTDETPPPMPDGIYIPSDAEVEAYMLEKIRQVTPGKGGYATISLAAYKFLSGFPTIKTDIFTDPEIGLTAAASLTEAIANHAVKVAEYKPGQVQREQAAKLIAEAEELEAKS